MDTWASGLVCPVTKLKVSPTPLSRAREVMGGELRYRSPQEGYRATPFGETETVLLREDDQAAYPIVEGVPILLAPEILVPAGEGEPHFDLSTMQYDEAYKEMDFYNSVGFKEVDRIRQDGSLAGSREPGTRHLEVIATLPHEDRKRFPKPREIWLTSIPDIAGEAECYEFLTPLEGRTIAQIGGTGTHALRLLLGGGKRAVLITPMLGEALATREIARLLGLEEKLTCVVGIGEEIPLEGASADICFAAGCVHHMETELAFPEIARVLRKGGKFAAIDIWRAPFYAIGTKIFGKREPNPHCRPLTADRIAPLYSGIFSSPQCNQHGGFTRYPIIVLEKAGLVSSLTTAWRLSQLDRVLTRLIPGSRWLGSGLSILAVR